MKTLLTLAALSILPLAAGADVLYTQPHNGLGTVLLSSYVDPDGSNRDEYVWDSFRLQASGSITEIQWRGGGGQPITDFEVSIYASIPAGTQPDLGGVPLRHYQMSELGLGNAGQTLAGTFGGVVMYDYHFVLPAAFQAAANTTYWVQIEAWTSYWLPTWGMGAASGGNGSHFARVPAVTGDFRFIMAAGDAAFTLIGTPVTCSAPTITQDPSPVALCFMGPPAAFSTAAAGTGPFTYRWRLNGLPVYDGPNGGGTGGGATISGATTATLTIDMPSYWHDVGTYTCEVANACGPTVSAGATLTVSFGAPAITANPNPVSTCPGGSAGFQIAATNSPLTYQWKKDGIAIGDGPTATGAVISGATTATLSISGAQSGDQGVYACFAGNPCGGATSTAAQLTVCPADYNCDGFVDGIDYDQFMADFENPDPVQQIHADYNCDGFVDGIDYDEFMNAFAILCV